MPQNEAQEPSRLTIDRDEVTAELLDELSTKTLENAQLKSAVRGLQKQLVELSKGQQGAEGAPS